MSTPMPETSLAISSSLQVRVVGPAGLDAEYELVEGDALVVGASPACGIRIEGDGIAAMHCTISRENGEIVVDDWDTGSGTYVGDNRVARQAIVAEGEDVRISGYRFTFRYDEADESGASEVAGESNRPEAGVAIEPPAEIAQENEPAAAFPEVAEKPAVPPAAVESSTGSAQSTPFDDPADDAWDTPSAANESAWSDDLSPESYDRDGLVSSDDTAELLRIELDYLRTELADRDARVAELEQALEGNPQAVDDELPTREEVDSLASRLEDLLAELEQSDERLNTMAELLKVSEEANVASEEERVQMESWIGEVERRVRQWEEEWHAERDTLNRKVAELTSQRDEAESRGGSKEDVALIQKLRGELSRFEEQVAELTSQRDELQQRIESADVGSFEDRLAKAVEDAMREERLELSQAKAECARERAQLMKQQEEMQYKQVANESSADIADLKIRAFRQHLKEIRDTEPQVRPQASMSQRLGKLWRKIEGRPLDTD